MSIKVCYHLPMAPRTENAQAKKDKMAAILDAACSVIREKGYHQARMADVAARAGISYGLVYHYFKSKSELFDVLIEVWWAGLDEVAANMAASTLPVEKKLGAIVDYFLDQYQKRPDLVHVFITEFSRSTVNLTPERLQYFKRLMSRTEEIITTAQKDGAIRYDLKPRYLTYAFLGSIEALISAMVYENQPLRSQKHKSRLAEAVLTAFLDGARPS